MIQLPSSEPTDQIDIIKGGYPDITASRHDKQEVDSIAYRNFLSKMNLITTNSWDKEE